MPVTINGTAGVTFNNSSVASVGGVGDGQTWQVVTGSRALSTTYTNSTGKPIMIAFITSSGTSAVVTVGGAAITEGGAFSSAYGTMFVIVPNNATYSIAGGNIQRWSELR